MGPKGIVDRIQPGPTYIDHSINSAELVRTVGSALANRNVKILNIPLDGGRDGALPGDLTLLGGGDRDALASVRPVLESFLSDVVWVGELGTGSVTKIVHNALAIGVGLLATDCLIFGVKDGMELPR